jgi:predicted GNAT family acetyltransferase
MTTKRTPELASRVARAVWGHHGVGRGRTIGVYSIATIESVRRRGYGAAMTARVVADGVAAGCDVAALQASDMGRSIYERLGFRTLVRYAAYVEPIPGA